MLRHVEDSLSVAASIHEHWIAHTDQPDSNGIHIVDIGAGAGLPALVLAIARPDWKVTALETLKKRCTFMEMVCTELSLDNVHILWSRAEDAGRDKDNYREAFDVATARAVAETRILAELSLPLVKVGGLWIAAKASNVDDEVANAQRAIEECGGAVEAIPSLVVDGIERTVLVVKKKYPTPDKYPRRAGMPNKRPL